MLRRAAEPEYEIIGEARSKILKLDADFPIGNARRIVDLRNLVIDGYDKVDNVIVWGILSRNLPKLKSELDNLLQKDSE